MDTKQNEKEHQWEGRLKSVSGWDGEKLLKELEISERDISEEELPCSGDYSFERLLKDIEKRGLRPSDCSGGIRFETKYMKKKRELSLQTAVMLIRTSTAAAAAVSAALLMGMMAVT